MKCELLTANIQNYAHPGVRGTHPCITITGRTRNRIRRRWRPSLSREKVWPPLLKLLRLLKIGMF